MKRIIITTYRLIKSPGDDGLSGRPEGRGR